MLITLLAPSEAKQEGGEGIFNPSTLFLEELTPLRKRLIDNYCKLIKGDRNTLYRLFGIKKEEEITRYASIDPLFSPTIPAIKRYSGVAFKYLEYSSLPKEAQKYIRENTIIFSNLFGPILAGDNLPDYRLKQGARVGDICVELEYRKLSSGILDNYLEGKDILDLRANFYEKYYKPSHYYTKLKFLKNGKVVSHWAKAYRGIVLRNIALNGIKSLNDFTALDIPTLKLEELRRYKKYQEIIYSIEE